MTTCAEIVDFFVTRTNAHIENVKKNWYKLTKNSYLNKIICGCISHVEGHDTSKFRYPECVPYILLTWCYKNNENVPYLIRQQVQNVTFNHIKTNMHHPEYWDENLQSQHQLNLDNRDKINNYLVDATKMPDWAICEMVCDWAAVSKERNSSLKKWADKNIGVRWNFNSKQKKMIYKIINYLENN